MIGPKYETNKINKIKRTRVYEALFQGQKVSFNSKDFHVKIHCR
jgi:hypothetical protein